MSTLAHHGILYVPFGYSHAFAQITNLEEVHGGESIIPCSPSVLFGEFLEMARLLSLS
jgi:hypothetical protein